VIRVAKAAMIFNMFIARPANQRPSEKGMMLFRKAVYTDLLKPILEITIANNIPGAWMPGAIISLLKT